MDANRAIADARGTYERIDESDNPGGLLEHEIQEHPKGINREDYGSLCKDYPGAVSISQYVNSTISMIVRMDLGVSAFYQKLWEIISSDAVLATYDDKVMALFFVLTNSSLPYRRLPLVRMDSAEFSRRLESLSNDLDEIRRIVVRDFEQATEEASAILDVVERHDDIRDRSVLLASYVLLRRQQA